MIRLNIRINSEEAKRQLRAKQGALKAALRGFRNVGGPLVRGIMVMVIRERQKQGTGFLSNSVEWIPTGGGFWVGSRTTYAPFVDKPTRPHLIRPVRARALAFPAAGGRLTRSRSTGHVRTRFTFGGRSVTTDARFAAFVRHPGTKGMDFTGETARRAQQPLMGVLADAVAKAVETT